MEMVKNSQSKGQFKAIKQRKKGINIRISYDGIFDLFITSAVALLIANTGFPFWIALIIVAAYFSIPIKISTYAMKRGNLNYVILLSGIYYAVAVALTIFTVHVLLALF